MERLHCHCKCQELVQGSCANSPGPEFWSTYRPESNGGKCFRMYIHDLFAAWVAVRLKHLRNRRCVPTTPTRGYPGCWPRYWPYSPPADKWLCLALRPKGHRAFHVNVIARAKSVHLSQSWPQLVWRQSCRLPSSLAETLAFSLVYFRLCGRANVD